MKHNRIKYSYQNFECLRPSSRLSFVRIYITVNTITVDYGNETFTLKERFHFFIDNLVIEITSQFDSIDVIEDNKLNIGLGWFHEELWLNGSNISNDGSLKDFRNQVGEILCIDGDIIDHYKLKFDAIQDTKTKYDSFLPNQLIR